MLKRVDQRAHVELKAFEMGSIIGGPLPIGLATFQAKDQPTHAYVVMEELFPGQRSVTLKGLLKIAGNQKRVCAEQLIAGQPSVRLTRQLADWLAKGLFHDILAPYDFDFIMTADEIRLIDVESLAFGRRAKTKDWDRFFAHYTTKHISKALMFNFGPDVVDAFRTDLAASLRSAIGDLDRCERIDIAIEEASAE